MPDAGEREMETPIFHIEDEALVSHYENYGFAAIANIWTSVQCHAIVDFARAFPGRASNDFRPLMQPQRTESAFLSAIRDPRVVHLIERVLGGPASGLQIQFFFGHPGTRGYACHQDNYYVEASPNGFASLWFALTDVKSEMGAIFVHPGSHRFGRLPVRKLQGDPGPNQDPNAQNEATILPDTVSSIPKVLPLHQGQAVLLHGDIAHGSLDNNSDKFRFALLCTFVRRGAAFRPGRTAQRAEIELRQ